MIPQDEKTASTTPAARKSQTPQGVVLAAGKGSRLGKAADGLPKCLIQVGGQTLIRHQMDALADAGVGPVLVMIGYGADLVRETVGNSAEFILNPRYAATNSLHTFHLAKEWIKGPVVILNSDVIADPRLLEALLRSGEDSLAYDSLSGYAREHMKVAVRDGKVTNMSKDLPEEGTSGENVGMLYLSRRTLDVVFNQAEKLVAADRTDAFLAEAIRASLGLIELKAVDVAGLPWTEIDTPHDLERARRELWPRIAERFRKRTGEWRARERRRKFVWALALLAAVAIVFAAARLSAPKHWETMALEGGRPAAVTMDGVAHPWWQIEGQEFVGAEIDGPRAVTVELSASGADLRLDGRPVVGEGQRIRVDVPAGRHRLEVGLKPGDSRALRIRFRVQAPPG